MPIPIRQNLRVGAHLMRQRLKRNQYFPFIVEIEPLVDERGFFARTYCAETLRAAGAAFVAACGGRRIDYLIWGLPRRSEFCGFLQLFVGVAALYSASNRRPWLSGDAGSIVFAADLRC